MVALLPLLIINMVSLSVRDKLKTSGMVAYFVVFMFSLDLLYFAALVDFLKPATIFVFSVYIFIALWHFIKSARQHKKIFSFSNIDVYLLLHNISCVVFAVLFSIRKPTLYYWDELNLWGPSAKAVKLFDKLYSIGINPSTNDRNYPAGNAILNYFISFFDSEFKEYVLLLSYALLFLACFAVAASVIYKFTQNHTIAVGAYFVLLLSPFMAAYHLPVADYSSISYAYGTTLVDFNLAVVFLGALALYFAKADSKWYVLPLVYLITVKKNGIFFALLLVCVVFCLEFFTFKTEKWDFRKAFVSVLAALVIPLVSYGAWQVHLDYYETERQPAIFDLKETEATQPVSTENAVQQKETAQSTSVSKAVKPNQTSIKAIFIPSLRTDRYNRILDEMSWYFHNNYETIFMQDLWLIAFLRLLGIVTAFRRPKGQKIALLFIAVGLTAGCFVYNLVIGYQMQFYNDMMVEYPRYMVSYYFSWMYLAFFLFIISAGVKGFPKQLLISVILVFTTFNIYRTGLDYTVFDSPENVYKWRRNVTENTEFANSVLEKEDRVYLVYKDQDIQTYMRYRYNLQPAYVSVDTKQTGIDFSINFRESLDPASDRQYYLIASPEKYTEVMREYFDYIFVAQCDRDFYDSYSHLFSDGLTDNTLYRITDNRIPMEVVK